MSKEIVVTEERARVVLTECWGNGVAHGIAIGVLLTLAVCVAIYVWRIYPLICQ